MMASDGVAARLLSLAAAIRSCGAPYYILQRAVVLNKVEVRGSNRAKRKAEVALRRRLSKKPRAEERRSPNLNRCRRDAFVAPGSKRGGSRGAWRSRERRRRRCGACAECRCRWRDAR